MPHKTQNHILHNKGKTKKQKHRVVQKFNNNNNNIKYTQAFIVSTFLQMLNTVKLYHWKTHSYAQHKATDDLYGKINENIDSFVEIMLGKNGSRVNLTGKKSLHLSDFTNVGDFKREIEKYKIFLISMNNVSSLNIINNSDLLNVRDELLGNMNQFSYLLTFV